MYIRTKDGVYGLSEAYWAGNKDEILNQSENLVELCDEFVGVDKTCENGHQLLRAVPYKCANFWNGGVYGAVWTSKGLIYVAKMNENGELELI